MNFSELTKVRQSCRSYDPNKAVENDLLEAIAASARLAPSACNSQPYFLTVCTGEKAKQVIAQTMGQGRNSFAKDAPAAIVISEMPYSQRAEQGAAAMQNDFRSIDIGIVAAYITAEAADRGLGSCILGWLEDAEIRRICNLSGKVRLVILLGYAKEDPLRDKVRKDNDQLIAYLK